MAQENGQGDGRNSIGESPAADALTRVRLAPGLQLTDEQIALLDRAIPAERDILVKQEFRSGYSGAIVMLVSVGAGRAPLVVKLAHPHDLQSEYDAYEEYVRQVSPQNIAHLQGEPLVSEDGQLGLLQYTFAGGESHLPTTSLQTYYESAGAAKTSEVLNRIFRVFGRHWWADNRAQSYVLDEYYDRLLPVHLQAKPSADGAISDHTIEAGKSGVLVVTELEQGEILHLVGFRVTKSRNEGRRLTLLAPPPRNQAAAPLRIRVVCDTPTAYTPGDIVESLTVEVTATRMSLLGDEASAALPGFDPAAKTLTLPADPEAGYPEGASLPNPLLTMPDQLYGVVETKMSIIHGDLNMQNVLVDAPTGFAWLIDFAETRVGPTLLDLQRLEVQVFTKLIPDTSDIPLCAVADMMGRLHADPPLPSPDVAALREPYMLLVTIRRLARQYLIDDLDWNEYYYGLVTALVGALKYDELDTKTRALALVTAAAVEEQVGQPLRSAHHGRLAAQAAVSALDTEHGTTPATAASAVGATAEPQAGSRRNVFVGIGIALVAIVLVAVVGWQLAGRSKSTPEQASAPVTVVANNTPQSDADAEVTGTVEDGEAAKPVAGDTDVPNAADSEETTVERDESSGDSETGEESVAEPLADAEGEPAADDESTEDAKADVVAVAAPVLGDVFTNAADSAEYIFIPGTEFEMGSDEGTDEEGPAHKVSLDDFWMMREEVTNAQYRLCVEAGVCSEPSTDGWTDVESADLPVTNVDWEQATQYAEWAGGRLPTEAEWEMAARGDDSRPYPWGEATPTGTLTNFKFTAGGVTPVGSYPDGAGPYGHLDMAGNVEEWVADIYEPDYYSASPTENPQGPEDGPMRSMRGGSYFSNGLGVQAFARGKGLPNSKHESVGFRVAVSAEDVTGR